MKNFLTILALGFVMYLVFAAMITVQEQNECNQWANEENQYRFHGWSNWQIDQCSHYNIKLTK